MQSQGNSICKHNQTGYCKYNKSCTNTHINEVCKQTYCEQSTCNKRHPKDCKKFNSSAGCRFKDRCAYKHINSLTSTDQSAINQAVAEVTIKHEDDIKLIKEELTEMKSAMKIMQDKIKILTDELEDISRVEKEVQIIEHSVSDSVENQHNM